MSSSRKEIGRELLDALRGASDAEGSDDARQDNGSSAQARESSRARARPRERRGEARGPRPGGNGASVFQDIRLRARDAVRGLRDGGDGDGVSALRERRGGAPGALREGDGGARPPWREAPALPPPPAPPPPGNGRPRLKKLRLALVLAGLALLALVSWFFGIMMSVAQDLPALENREQYKNARNSVVVDRDGDKLATLTGNERRILLPSPEISQTVKQAVVAVEDQRFYEHRGVDFQGIGRAIVQDVMQQNTVQGGSTITQQFVKNALRAQDSRTVFQKLREAALAYHLERRWSKDKILTEYLNSIYFGEGAYGIESAAQTYFGWNHPECGAEGERCASELLPEEAALLAGMISSPTAYSPRNNPAAASERRNLVLQKMVEQGVMSPEQYEQSAETDVPKPSQIKTPDEDSLSPYFTSWLRQQVVDRYGAGEAFGGGLEVESTIDLEFQQQVEEIGYSTLSGIDPTASIAVIDNKTGGVLAMVGGNDFEKEPFNLATNGHRQPGSAFKPFTLITALSNGVPPDRVFSSQPKTFRFKAPGSKKPELFEVKNYDDNYLGSASLASATTYSDNSVYAELGLEVGTDKIAKVAEKMGVQTNISTNPAMTLGGLETGVSPLEMAYAYSTLGRSGERVGGTMDSIPGPQLGPVAIENVTVIGDEGGEPVEDKTGASGENEIQTEQVLDASASDTAVGMLESVVSSGTGKAAATGDFEWGKTGTTDDNGDAWFVGGTENITAAVWVGHADSNTPMETEYGGQPVDGGTFPAEIWHDVVLAYESTIGSSDGRKKKSSDDDATTTTPSYTPPTEPVAPEEPVAPAPEEPAPEAPQDQAAPAPAPAPAPTPQGGGAGGETGATGASP
jgi:penicillin-binding protein 1A